MPPRTIDNLGIDVSTRYAEDQKILDESLIKESQSIPSQTQIDVSSPSFPLEIEELFSLQPTISSWASFPPPQGYFEQRKRLFTFQMIPSMGSEDKKESQALKILKSNPPATEQQSYDERLLLEKEERERKILTSLLNKIIHFDKIIVEINSKRNQYQKG